jgi:hypothetical protein
VRTRPKTIVLAVIIGVVTFAPIDAFAQQEQEQAATQVTVDLSELERSGQHEPLAQTGNTQQLLAAGIAAAGASAIGLGLRIKRSQ